MTTKYTPGPWEAKESATHIRVVGANNEVLFHDDKRAPMVKGDARLIAAAPDLLEALQSIVDGGLSTSRIAAAKAAIAKATGEQE